jgi:hypothetical protein
MRYRRARSPSARRLQPSALGLRSRGFFLSRCGARADRVGAIARVPGRFAVVFDMRCATPPGVTPCWFPTLSALVKPRATQFSIVSEPPGETNDTLWAPKPAPSSIKPLLRRAVSSRRAAHSSRESRAPMDFPAGVTTSMKQRRSRAARTGEERVRRRSTSRTIRLQSRS